MGDLMLVYALASAGVLAVLLTGFLIRHGYHASLTGHMLLNLRRFLIPFDVTGVAIWHLEAMVPVSRGNLPNCLLVLLFRS
jgi:hypothetical protein